MLKALKGMLGQTVAAMGLDQWLLQEYSVIVSFHRVQPSDGSDSLTMPVQEFEECCRYFRSHFDVVPLTEIVGRLTSGCPLDRTLAITFDDGYRDNFEHAAPILDRLDLPATFFIVSDWIGTDNAAWWDLKRGVKYPSMDWDQVRTLRARGFDIGAHTRTHVDLGSVTEEVARAEIVESRRRIEREIGGSVATFAYPYGRRENITPAAEQFVRDAGYICCCASYGGVNRAGTDPFHLRRIPLTPETASPHALTFDVAFGRTQLSTGRS
jgi:peptidoglycan/xylan/chitin deacetylase (PgdA/CDA1 family)